MSVGGIAPDDYQQTSVSGVYAIGDAATLYQHIAMFKAKFVQARILDGASAAIEYGAISHAAVSEALVVAARAAIAAVEQGK